MSNIKLYEVITNKGIIHTKSKNKQNAEKNACLIGKKGTRIIDSYPINCLGEKLL